MDGIAQVREFSRTVTQRVGALDETFLALRRPLAQARVLWEIGADGTELRDLRARMELDSGYLTRLLRGLQNDGLVTVGVDAADGRARVARLTPAGQAERAELDRRSDERAASILRPLNDGQRERLLGAMAEVQRLLTASMVRVEVTDPAHPDARACLAAYFAELDERFDGGFDLALNVFGDEQFRAPAGLFVVARLHDVPVGCGSLRFLNGGADAHLKRMWVAGDVRGLGLGRRLLGDLEAHAAASGASAVVLETNRALYEAIALYRATGYTEVEAFNTDPYGQHWFRKELGRPDGAVA